MPGIVATAARPFRRLAAAVARQWDYDAAVNTHRRRAPRVTLKHEDEHLKASDRKRVVATARDLPRNFEVAAWAIRKHLDYVASHSFQANTGDRGLDRELEAFVRTASRRRNFDAAGRHNLRRFVRIAEARRTIDGDFFFQKLRSGQVAGIEGDRFRTPTGREPSDHYTHGVRTAASGAAMGYALHNRTRWGGFEFQREIPARYVIPFGYFDRIDQIRGIGLITPAINRLQDVYEGFDYALAKAKVTQLFGLALYRDDDQSIGDVETDTDDDGNEDKSAATIDFGRGPFQLDLGTQDKAEFLESKHPSAEFKDYSSLMISVALKALDIPYSFFDESFTTYSGSREALLLYEQSAQEKRADVQEVLDEWTAWRLATALLDGELTLPRSMTLDTLRWEWIGRGLPWIQPLQEIKADIEAINAGLSSPQRVLKRQQLDFDVIVDELAYARERLAELPQVPSTHPPVAPEPPE